MPVAVAVAGQAQLLRNNLSRPINILLPAALAVLEAGRLEPQTIRYPQQLQPTLAVAAAAQGTPQDCLALEALAAQA